MLLQDAFKTATKSLTYGKMRSILTMLGIVIGIASVIILMSIGQSAQNLILGEVESIGSNLLIVMPGAPSSNGFAAPASMQGIVITTLKEKDADALQREPSIGEVASMVSGQAEAVNGNENKNVTYQGTSSNLFAVRNLELGSGMIFTDADVASGNHVAVIGAELAKTLFGPNVDPLNKTFRLNSRSFRVVGVLSEGGYGAFGVEKDNLVMIPLSVAQRELLGITHINAILAEADPSYDIDFVKSRSAFALRQNHGITDPKKDDFDIQTQADILSILDNITSVLTLFLTAIASISLIVGGIGIMNIMLVAVTERTREIGLRKAVGATNNDILQQFLIESVLLTSIGGLIGIAFGAGIVGLISLAITNFTETEWVFAFPISAVVLGLTVSSISGIVFGIYPARQAGKKNPIDALRYE